LEEGCSHFAEGLPVEGEMGSELAHTHIGSKNGAGNIFEYFQSDLMCQKYKLVQGIELEREEMDQLDRQQPFLRLRDRGPGKRDLTRKRRNSMHLE
jgi:hypothetical protein